MHLRELGGGLPHSEGLFPATKCEKQKQVVRQDINKFPTMMFKKSAAQKRMPALRPTSHNDRVAFSQPLIMEESCTLVRNLTAVAFHMIRCFYWDMHMSNRT